MSQPDAWLRGPIDGIDPLLQPVAHSLTQTLEDVEKALAAFDGALLWRRPGEAASVGFHLQHLAGATDRLLTYARGEALSDQQRASLATESSEDPHATVASLLERLRAVVGSGIAQLRSTAPGALNEPRFIGRAKLPTTVIGCLVHAAEHAYRHAGQLATTVRVLR